MNDAMNARFETVCDAFRGQKKNSEADVQKIQVLEKKIQGLKVAQSTMARNDGASTTKMGVRDDALLARILQKHEEMKAKMDVATAANKRVESLEEALRVLKQQHEDAVLEAENWKKEALQTGNKRSRMATSPTSTLKIPSSTLKISPDATPRKTPVERVEDPSQLMQLHTLEVNALKELRLQKLNRRQEAEQENAKLKEELAKLAASKSVPKSAFQQKLDDAEGSAAKTGTGKKKPGDGEEGTRLTEREVFVKDAKKELGNKRKDELIEICMKEGVKYNTIPKTITDIIEKRVERAFGKKAEVQDISEDGCEPNSKEDSRNSADS
ncbi:hypothetical protein CBR_g30758 [Chara braunii]|uniref:Uncharacterized protein n=1 Tax=Chara braunii TaxID=69332 RepID=A0A388LDK3_CHABU|nr:hypothetical protein CBR_g30758 [Chara braunii]|eukprot:GBG80390.1 hypothetical protein CBR_g30758 [Chara braunii]